MISDPFGSIYDDDHSEEVARLEREGLIKVIDGGKGGIELTAKGKAERDRRKMIRDEERS